MTLHLSTISPNSHRLHVETKLSMYICVGVCTG